MWFSYAPEIKAVIRFTELLKVKVSRATISATLQAHPDWPSLLCISDSLKKWKVPNAAAKIAPSEIDELPVPFIAYLPGQPAPLSVVTAYNAETVTAYSGNYEKPRTIQRDSFLEQWQGVYLIAEPDGESGEAAYNQKKRNAFIKSLVPVSLVLLVLGICIFLLNRNLQYELPSAVASTWVQFSILAAGTFIAILLLWYETDRNNPVLKKVCGAVAQGNCGAILTSKASKIFDWLSWSEAGFFFFAGSLLNLVANPYNPLLNVLSLLALPYIFFSVYYQWRIAKQWCVLCLAVQALLLAWGMNVLLSGNPLFLKGLNADMLLLAMALYLLTALAWYVIKPVLKTQQRAKEEKRQYLRMKFNTEVFETLLAKQQKITSPIEGLGIVLGNPQAKHEIVKVCNPYCNPCALAHPRLENILEQNPDLKARIIFNATNNEGDFRAEVVKHLLAVQAEGNAVITREAVDAWYSAETKDYNLFATRYPTNGAIKQQDGKVEAMDEWCKMNNIQFTPTFFINGKQLPNAYSIDDVQYFLAE